MKRALSFIFAILFASALSASTLPQLLQKAKEQYRLAAFSDALKTLDALEKALYTSSTVALDVDTGKLAWYYSHAPSEALAALPEDQRKVILLRFGEEKSIREIASDLNRSEGAVKQLQFRGLENLRARLRE